VLQRRRLVPELLFPSLGPGTSVSEHDLDPAIGLIDQSISFHLRLRKQLLCFPASLAHHPVHFGLGLTGQLVNHRLSQLQHLGGLNIGVNTRRGRPHRRRQCRDHHWSRRLHQEKIRPGGHLRAASLSTELLDPVAKAVVVVDQPSQFGRA
jgi:hypothetical protein